MKYKSVTPPYKPPKQRQSIFDFYIRLDRLADMQIWYDNLNRVKNKKPSIYFNSIEEKREYARMSKKMRMRIT